MHFKEKLKYKGHTIKVIA